MYNYMLYEKFKNDNNNNNSMGIKKDNHNPTYFINTFDDGNRKYQELKNEWIITGNPNPGKVTLLHKNSSTTIKSISAWKIQLIENDYKKENQ